jgi:hypothetical protein
MAVLFVTEYDAQAWDAVANTIPAGEEPYLAHQTIAIGGTSTPVTNPFNPKTRFVRVHTDAICSIKFGVGTPVATASEPRMAANQTEFFGVDASLGTMKIAVITNT